MQKNAKKKNAKKNAKTIFFLKKWHARLFPALFS
jgi:hypothetical protein